ncbi:MAG: hypothetical protein HY796_03325, partial [Elusimicrobia bacterium]|nr:hypothetical protein [Elusimicrobiota bacterium]
MSAGYSSEITGIEAHYIGNYLLIHDGNKQTGLVNEKLPKALSVKVFNEETGEFVPDVPITFSILDPVNGAKFSNGQASIVANTHIVTSTIVIADVKLTLGTSTGTYKVKATCPAEVCTSGAKEVTFTEKAVGTALTCVSCEWHGKIGERLANPFRLKVVNPVNGAPIAGSAVNYDVI